MRHVAALLLLLLPGLAVGAQDFGGASGDQATSSTVEVTQPPMTLCCWGKSDTDAGTAGQAAIAIGRATTTTERFGLFWRGNVAGDPISALSAANGVTVLADTTTGYSAAVWHHGCAVFTSVNSRSAYIDGGSKSTNTTSNIPGTPTSTAIAASHNGSPGTISNQFDGAIAECGIWDVALTDGEVASLAAGYAPPCVRRAALVAYYPLVQDSASAKDHFGTINNLTLAGTTAAVEHPRIITCQ